MRLADALNAPHGIGAGMAKKQGAITMMWGYNMTGMGWWMIISSLIWLGLIAVAVWAFARWANRPSQPDSSHRSNFPPAQSAIEILRQRFARGEIDSNTFERMQRELDASAVEPRTPSTVA
jgi:putative membrane protein